jgi:feruloyl esterase
MADYAQSPYAGIRYFEGVQRTMGKAVTAEFARLYTAPGVDHVGSGAPANIDMLSVLIDWVEKGHAPDDLEVTEQKLEAPSFATVRALPLCQWPAWPHYRSGPTNLASSFLCAP